MALGTREMLLVIRARDEASRVLGRLSSQLEGLDRGAQQAAADAMARGGALVSLGAGITAVGGAGLAFFADTVEAAGEYETAARRAITQADGVKVSLEQMKEVGREVARDIPAAFSEMQEGLWTIFSTIDTDLPGAEKLLREFARASVAGGTDVKTAATGGLQAMNAFGLGVEGVTRVNDVMFQLVRKGVGTFEEFVTSIGKAAPSASRAGQDIESLSGMLAFMTRNGLSANMAATSAGRAFDLMANEKVVGRMEAMGITVKNAQGEFLPMTEIVTQLGQKMSDLSAPERAEALTNLFKGSGNNVQARRFFDLAVPGFQQLNDLTGSMRNSAGAMGDAYNIMFESPQSKMQALTNQYEIMKTEIGDQLLPVKMKLLELLSDALNFWDKLPGPVQKAIIIFGAVASVLAILVGIITVVAGAFLMIQGALLLAGTTFAAVATAGAVIIGVLAAIGVAVWLVIKYWDEIVAATKAAWDWIVQISKDAWNAVWGAIEGPLTWIRDKIVEGFNAVKEFLGEIWNSIEGPIRNGWNKISEAFREGVDFVVTKAQEFWDRIQGILEMLSPQIEMAGNIFQTFWEGLQMIWGYIVDLFNLVLPLLLAYWRYFVDMLQTGWVFLQGILKVGVEIFMGIFDALVDGFTWLWKGISRILGGLLEFASSFIGFMVALFTGNWSKLWEYFKGMITGVGNFLKGIGMLIATPFVMLWELIKGAFWAFVAALQGGFQTFLAFFEGLYGIVGAAVDWFMGIWDWLGNLKNDLISWMNDMAGDILGGFLEGLKAFWANITGWFSRMWNDLIEWFKNLFGIHSPSTLFLDFGKWILEGFLNGLKAMIGFILDFFGNILPWVLGKLGNVAGWLWDKGIGILKGLLDGIWNGATAVWDFFINLGGTILGKIGDFGQTLWQAGKDLLSGLWNGIQAAKDWLLQKVGDFFGNLLPGWVKDMLGIESPSKVFAELGNWTMLGFANGIDSGSVTAAESAVNAALAVSDAFNDSIHLDDPVFNDYSAGQLNAGNAASAAYADVDTTGANNQQGRNVKIDIHTQEINPLQHATELGMLISSQVG